MSSQHTLKRFLNPRSIALFGGSWAVNVMQQLQKSGYKGEIWPVHPRRDKMLGVKCFADVDSLPSAPDAAFIGVNREITFDVVSALSKADAGGAICFASGFREADFDGVLNAHNTSNNHSTYKGDRQDMLVDAAGDMPLLGPNCYGYINYLDNVILWPDQHGGKPCGRGVAIIAQSSNIAINMTMQKRGLNISYMITLGNQAQTGVSDLAEEILEDQRVSTIGLYLESFNDIRAFEKMAQHANSMGKSVVVLKIGKSLKAQMTTVSHTASLAGNAAASSALLKRLGMIEVDSIAVFLETLKLLDTIGPLAGKKIASVSCSGGEASLISDLAMNTHLEFVNFSEQQTNELAKVLGSKVTLANPLDYHTYIWGDVVLMTSCFAAVMKENFDLTVFILDIPRKDICDARGHECAIEAIINAKKLTGANVAVIGSLSENLDEEVSQRFLQAGIVPLHGMKDAVMAIDKAIVVSELQHIVEPIPVLLAPSFVKGKVKYNEKENEIKNTVVSIDEYQAKLFLADFGLVIPSSSKVANKDEIIETARKHSFPLALKGLGLEHKTEAGAVVLDIDSEESLRDALENLPECKDGYLIEEMAEKPIAELIIGVTRDDLGLFLLTIGAGGILTEILADTASILLPSNREEILTAIQSLKINQILAGYRGQGAANIEAIIDAVEAVSAYVEANYTSLQELDINPLLAGKNTATAVDALIRQIN